MEASIPERVLWNFYIADRNKTTFKYKEDVPRLVPQMVPIFTLLFILEYVFFYWRNGKYFRFNDGVTSIALGMMMETAKLITNGIELIGYEWLYERRFYDMDWQSPWTWWAAMLGVDFCYYWVHRAAHEINLFWASHQVHHSSEEYNLTTALRQSAFQHLFSLGFYQPLALVGVPLPALLVHLQFNLFVQYWIHTEMVPKLGPFEWVFNTASHHRVHHGINKWCLDKNYGAFLIIWDRIFGTFQAERDDEKIVYGLVTQPQRLEPIYLQLFYFRDVINKANSMDSLGNWFKALFYGPGWNPGTPRLGDEKALPDKTPPRKKFNPKIRPWVNVYLFSHFIVVIVVQQMITIKFATLNWLSAIGFITFIFFSLYTIGNALEGKFWVPLLEGFRCFVTILILQWKSFTQSPILDAFIIVYFLLSAVIWGAHSFLVFITIKAAKS